MRQGETLLELLGKGQFKGFDVEGFVENYVLYNVPLLSAASGLRSISALLLSQLAHEIFAATEGHV